jgi:predicted component of type VI protein secretion system
MKMFPRLFPVLLAAILPVLTGCETSKGSRMPGSDLAPTNPDTVEVLAQTPERNFRVVGVVNVVRSVGNLESKKTIERKFQVLAAKLGAQAVIIDIMPVGSFTGINVLKGEGRAIVWDNRKPQ